MPQVIRKAQPDCLRYFLQILRSPNNSHEGNSTNNNGREESCSVDNLVDILLKKGNYSVCKYLNKKCFFFLWMKYRFLYNL